MLEKTTQKILEWQEKHNILASDDELGELLDIIKTAVEEYNQGLLDNN